MDERRISHSGLRGGGWALPLLLALLLGLPGTAAAQSSDASAEAALRELEERLLDAPGLRFRYRIGAEGAISVALDGDLALAGSDAVALAADGLFGSRPVHLSLASRAGRIWGGNIEKRFNQPTPPELKPALVLGLTRMGILHNLAMLKAGRPPDHAEGGVETWVVSRNVRWVEEPSGVAGEDRGLRFDLEVAGSPAGSAELWLSAEGLPVRRRQVVPFPGGEMRVLEEYEEFLLQP